jgi:hypothetical protein
MKQHDTTDLPAYEGSDGNESSESFDDDCFPLTGEYSRHNELFLGPGKEPFVDFVTFAHHESE